MSSEESGQKDFNIFLAKWSTRFWAWIVDFIIVAIASEIIFAIAYAPLAFNQGIQQNPALAAAKYAVQSLIFFVYWTYFESTTGQSIGKRLLKIKTTAIDGSVPTTRDAAIQSFGKAFLLPFDVFLGWIFTNEKRQRLLSRAANTVVIRVPVLAEGDLQSSAHYRKD